MKIINILSIEHINNHIIYQTLIEHQKLTVPDNFCKKLKTHI
jgi:hypothetical protein